VHERAGAYKPSSSCQSFNTLLASLAPTKKKGRLLIFCGIPGSGKTTIARLVAKELGSAVHVQTDTIRFMIAVPAYDWPEGRFVYESMFLVGREALKRGYDVILDGTFLKEHYREEALQKLGHHYSLAFVVCVVAEEEVAMERNTLREAVVPEESFRRLAASFEMPKKAIVVRSDEMPQESAAKFVLESLVRREAWRKNRPEPVPTRPSAVTNAASTLARASGKPRR